jgi:predicted  nucleic acid-binding Zn-ribbon protein
MQIKAQECHDHSKKDTNDINPLLDRIKHLEGTNDQKSAEIVRLSHKIAQLETKIKEES